MFGRRRVRTRAKRPGGVGTRTPTGPLAFFALKAISPQSPHARERMQGALILVYLVPRCYTSEGLYRTTLVLVTGHLPQPTRHPKLPNLARGALT